METYSEKEAQRTFGPDAGSTGAIAVVFATAIALAIMRWRQDYYLVIIGAVAFTAATIGYQHRRRHCPGDNGHILGMGIGYTAMLTAFYVDNGPHLPLWDRLPTLAFWLLPSAVAAPSSPGQSSTPAGPARPRRIIRYLGRAARTPLPGWQERASTRGGDCTSVSSRLEQGQLAKPRSRGDDKLRRGEADRTLQRRGALRANGSKADGSPRRAASRRSLAQQTATRPERPPCCASRPLPCRGDATHHEMPGKRLTHPSRVTLKVSLGQVWCSVLSSKNRHNLEPPYGIEP